MYWSIEILSQKVSVILIQILKMVKAAHELWYCSRVYRLYTVVLQYTHYSCFLALTLKLFCTKRATVLSVPEEWIWFSLYGCYTAPLYVIVSLLSNELEYWGGQWTWYCVLRRSLLYLIPAHLGCPGKRGCMKWLLLLNYDSVLHLHYNRHLW